MRRIGTLRSPASISMDAGAHRQSSKLFRIARKALTLAALLLPLTANSWAATETVLHTWVDNMNNENGGPIAGLAIDASGNLYGATFGSSCSVGCGSVFKLTKQSSGAFTFQTIYFF